MNIYTSARERERWSITASKETKKRKTWTVTAWKEAKKERGELKEAKKERDQLKEAKEERGVLLPHRRKQRSPRCPDAALAKVNLGRTLGVT